MTQPAQYISGRTVQEQMDQLIGYVDTRAAEVATDAIASDVAQVHQDMLDADADASAAAASAAAAAGTLANAVKKTGEASQTIAGDITVSGDLSAGGDLSVAGAAGFTGAVTVPAPVNNTDAATKKYVDDQDALKISINDINSYAVGLTGNQTVTGVKTFTGRPLKVYVIGSGGETDVSIYIADNRTDAAHTIGTQTGPFTLGKIGFFDGSGNWGATLFTQITADGKAQLMLYIRNADGTRKSVTLASGD